MANDDIRMVVAESLARNQQHAAHADDMWKWMTEFLLRDLRTAGLAIETDWSDDLDAAPRDGTPVLVGWYDRTGKWWQTDAVWESDTQMYHDTSELRALRPMYWRPRPAPPQESEN